MDLQIVLLVLLALIVLNLLVVGVYIVFLIKDLRETVKKARIILEDVENMGGSLSAPVTTLMGVVNAVSEGVKVAKSITTLRSLRPEESLKEEKDV